MDRNTSSPMLGRRPALDGIRGIAIALVLARHAVPSVFEGSGFTGVGLFFVLSGFLITTLLIEENDQTGRIALGRFYARRALRLLPALYAMLLVYGLAVMLFVPRAELGENLAWLGYAAIYVTPFAEWQGAHIAPGLGVVWSLAVEEYFYFLWPLLFILVLRIRSPRVRLIMPAVLVLVVIVGRILSWNIYDDRIYGMPWTWVDCLIAGCIAAIAWKGGLIRSIPGWIQWVGVVTIAAASFYPGAKESGPFYYAGIATIALAAVVVVLGMVASPSKHLASLLNLAPVRWLGRRSYAIYLWNAIFLSAEKPFDVPRWIEMPLGLIVTLLVAELSFRYVERPALSLKKRFSSSRTSSSSRNNRAEDSLETRQ